MSTARPILVQKYGGSSVADVERLGKVADRVVAAKGGGHDVVVVVSAMGKTTDGLLTLAKQVAGDADPPRRELDMLLSTGERVSMALLSIAIHARGFEAISFTGSQSGILTNDRHFDARIIEVRPHRIEDELARGKIVIIAGYQGMSYKREITTLGRGGSDTTAVALAAALLAERCEIYSDVDGVYSADPRSVPDAKHIAEMSHDMLQEMAEAGAKVVCAQAVEWAKRSGIAIYARSTFDASDEPRQTIVRRATAGDELRARAVVAEKAVVRGTTATGTLEALARAAADARVAPKDIAFGARGGSFVVPLLNVPDWRGAKATLVASMPDLELVEGLASVSVVGDGLGPAEIAAMSAALTAAGIATVSFGASPLRLGALIAAEATTDAERALHAALVS